MQFAVWNQGQAQEIYFQHYSVEDGLTSSTIYDVLQDSEGFIWLGTEAGVSRFDGINFTNFSKQDGLGDNEVFQIFEDSKGRIWFFPFNGRLSYYEKGKIKSERNDEQFKETRIEGIFNKAFEDEFGNLWFGTQRSGVVLVSDDFIGRISFKPGTKNYNIQITGFNGTDSLYAKSGNRSLVVQLLKNDANFSLKVISETEPVGGSGPEELVEDALRSYASDVSTKTWVYTKAGKTLEYDRENKSFTLMFNGPNLSDALEDSEHNVWFGTLGQGLYMRSTLSSYYYDSRNLLNHDEVMSVIPSSGGFLAGMQDGSINELFDQQVYRLSIPGPPYNRVLDIIDDGDKHLIVADAGFFTHDKESQEIQHAKIGASKCAIATDSFYYVGTYNGLVKIAKEDLRNTKRLWSKRTTALCFDSKGQLWLGTNDGLYSVTEESIVAHSMKDQLLESRIRSIAALNDGLLLGTHGEGLLIFQGDSVRRISQKDGLSSNITHSIFKESDKLYWMGSNYGLNRIKFSDPSYSDYVIDVFDHENTLVSNYINDVYVKDGKVWVATDRGLSVFEQQSENQERLPPIYITAFEVNDRDTSVQSGYVLDHDQNKIGLSFTGISLRSGANTKFKYRLLGADDDWDISTDSRVKYQSLKPGKYTFEVLTVTSSGMQSAESAKLSFTISKPLWETWWFIVGLTLLVVLLIVGAVRAIIKYNKRKDLEEQNILIAAEKKISDELLLNILPEETAIELKLYGKASAKSHEEVTVFFSDFKGFTTIAEKMTPEELVEELDTCFRAFDSIIDKHNLEKIKTIGDAYMCAGGLTKGTSSTAHSVVDAALEIQQYMSSYRGERKLAKQPYFEARIGIHTGAVVAGVVGTRKFAFDIWGDTVNTASRIESSGEVGRINISATTYNLIKEKYKCVRRGKIQAKNKGEIEMYFVTERIY